MGGVSSKKKGKHIKFPLFDIEYEEKRIENGQYFSKQYYELYLRGMNCCHTGNYLLKTLNLIKGIQCISFDESSSNVSTEISNVLSPMSESLVPDLSRQQEADQRIYPNLEERINILLPINDFYHLLSIVKLIEQFYELSKEITSFLNNLLWQLSIQNCLTEEISLFKIIGDLIVFAMQFDQIKMLTPKLQNQLSLYHRIFLKTKVKGDSKISPFDKTFFPISENQMNCLSFFIAEHGPMMGALFRVFKEAIMENSDIERLVGVFAHLSCAILNQQLHRKEEFNSIYYMNIMTGSLLIYDHIIEKGVFRSSSHINTKACLETLIQCKNISDDSIIMGLLRCIKYCSKHYDDSNTPTNIVNLITNYLND